MSSARDNRVLRPTLQELARAYLAQTRRLAYRDLRANQDAPWASLACGAAGIAAALAQTKRRNARALAEADRWLRCAARDVRRPGAIWSPNTPDACSLHYSADGIRFIRILAAHARGANAIAARRALIAQCRAAANGPAELLQGSAGYLIALVILHRRGAEPRALAVADALAGEMLTRMAGPRGWGRANNLAFAHGRAGTLYALLTWSLAANRDLPAPFFDVLHAFAEDEEAHRAATPDAMRASWCNGAAGFTLLWARAFERTRSRAHLRFAERAARSVLARSPAASGDLCCGLGGGAYALLAMDRIAPNRGWIQRARAMGARAVDAMLADAGAWPNGLYKGYPGLVCLAHDLACAPQDRLGFPLIEG